MQIQSTPLDDIDRVDVAPDGVELFVAVTPEFEISWGKHPDGGSSEIPAGTKSAIAWWAGIR